MQAIIQNICSKVDGEFYHNFPMVESGKICYITVSQGESLIQVNDVLFGDVWVCSGKIKF